MATKLSDLMNRMQDLSSEAVEKHLALQIYGPLGSGKTVLAIGLAKYISPGQEVIHIDTSGSWVSLENHPGLKDGVEHIPYQQFSDLNTLAEGIKRKAPRLENVGTVVIDEFNTAYNELLGSLHNEATGHRAGELNTDEVDPKLYKPVNDACVVLIEAFLSAGVNLILVSHEREVSLGKNKPTIIRPDYSPRADSQIQRKLHVTAHLSNRITGTSKEPVYERTVQSHPSATIHAKSRLGGLPVTTDTAGFVQVIHDWMFSSEGFVPETKNIVDDPPQVDGPISQEVDEEEGIVVE